MKGIKNIQVLILFLMATFAVNAQVTKVGNDTLIDVVSWNVEWLGNTSNGPSNEALQYTNVKTAIANTDMDVWGLSEVCDASLFSSLLQDLSVYDGTLSSFSQTQKTAMLWKKSKFDLVSYMNINDLSQSDFYNAFAGRYPLEVVLKTKGNTLVDTIYFYTVHLKANSGSADQSSYDRRKNSVTYLKTWLNANRRGKKIIVMGDWNDDLDQSVVMISGSYLPTPFSAFDSDTANYFFPSKRLSLTGETSYPNYNPKNMIDHQMATRVLSDSFYVTNSAAVMKQLSTQISSYINTTTDHYPVYARYNFKRYPRAVPADTTPVDTVKTGLSQIESMPEMMIYPNPSQGTITIGGHQPIQLFELYNTLGELVYTTSIQTNTRTITLPGYLVNGVYIGLFQSSQQTYHTKFNLLR
jgi:exonuclease III